jgi:subtilisin family serine protease
MHLYSLACRAGAASGLLIASVLVPQRAFAQPTRMSADLIDQLAVNTSEIDVIVHGTESEVAALASRHGAFVIRYLKTGGVLRVTAAQLAALRIDGSQDHLASDVPIYSTATVTAQTILADRAWAGTEALPALSGAGIGIALIDSGIDTRHETLRDRVSVSVDFTGGDGQDASATARTWRA